MHYEFSKILIFVDYLMFFLLILLTLIFQTVDFITLDIAWIAQLGVSTGFYYWKTKSDNRIKVRILVMNSLPKNIREELNVTEIISEILRQSN